MFLSINTVPTSHAKEPMSGFFIKGNNYLYSKFWTGIIRQLKHIPTASSLKMHEKILVSSMLHLKYAE